MVSIYVDEKECMICRMIENKEPYHIVKKNDKFIAIYHTSSRFIGHVLIFPKKHIESYDEITNILKFYEFVDSVHSHIESKYQPSATKILLKNGTNAGQKIQHIHFEIIPYE